MLTLIYLMAGSIINDFIHICYNYNSIVYIVLIATSPHKKELNFVCLAFQNIIKLYTCRAVFFILPLTDIDTFDIIADNIHYEDIP